MNKAKPKRPSAVAKLREAATSLRTIKDAMTLLSNSLLTTGTAYTTRVKVANALDAAQSKLTIAALALDNEADLQAIAEGIDRR